MGKTSSRSIELHFVVLVHTDLLICFFFFAHTSTPVPFYSLPLSQAFLSSLYYHMGTIAFGSLIIAIILTIRAILAYIQRKAKKSHNKILEYLACIIGCIVWCIEKIMRFINKHAYIMTAIYGYSFCKAARTGFFLVLRNILRVAAVNMVSSFCLFIGRVSRSYRSSLSWCEDR